MQSQPTPSYTYDALGRIVMAAPSGASNDVMMTTNAVAVTHPVAVAVTPGSSVSQELTFGTNGLLHSTVLNAPHLFTPTISITNPPIPLIPAVAQAAPGTMIATAKPFLSPANSQS